MSTEVTHLERQAETYRDYSEELKASVIAAIEANNGNVLGTARLFNLPRDTVNYWWRHSDRFVEIKHASALVLADKLAGIAHNTADSMADHDLRFVTYRDKASALGTVIDKMQLLLGQPTSIVETVGREGLADRLSDTLQDVIDVTPES